MTRAAVIKRSILVLLAALAVIGIVVMTLRSHDGSSQLADLIDRADRLVVRKDPWDGSAILFESSDRRDLDPLKAILRVEEPEQYLHCMCRGTPAISFYAKGEKIGQVTNHHAKLVRCSLWKSDARLVHVEAFLEWFDDRNMPGPRKDYQDRLERDAQWQRDERRWVESMPAALKALWPAAKRSSESSLAPLRKALTEQIPENDARILALFSWYGSGAGPWSGFPSYEAIAEKMLLDYPTGELLAAVEGQELTETQTEGVARLFGGWTFSELRPNDRRLLSADLKLRLLRHSLASVDEDKRGRAQRAFGGE